MARRRSSRFSPRGNAQDIEIGILRELTLAEQGLVALTREQQAALNHLANIVNGISDAQSNMLKRITDVRIADFNKRYVALVSAKISQAQIETAEQLEKLISDAFAEIMKNSVASTRAVMSRFNTEAGRQTLFQTQNDAITSKKFRLFVYDIAALTGADYIEGRLGILAGHLKEKAQRAILDCLEDAFTEAWEPLDFDAFPLQYRLQILALLPQKAKMVKIYGPDVQRWEIFVDFENLFGDYNDFTKGMHHRAILESESYRTVKRVRLPYTKAQKMKNPKIRRYFYWKAMWYGEPYIGTYEFMTNRNSAKARQNRENSYTKAITDKQQEINELEKSITDSGRKVNENSPSLGSRFGPTREEKERLDTLRNQKDELIIAQRNSRNFKPIETKGQREQTLDARMAVWGKTAPYWTLLEYGQLKWHPKIPPRGVRYRFYIKIREMVSDMARTMFNDEFEGVKVGRTGRYYLRSGATPWSIPYVGIKPTTKPGGFLPKNLVRKQIDAMGTAQRNAEMAERVSGRFSASKEIKRDIDRFRTVSQYYEEAHRQYVSDMERLFGVEGYPAFNAGLPVEPELLRKTGNSPDYIEARDFWRANKAYQDAKARVLGRG